MSAIDPPTGGSPITVAHSGNLWHPAQVVFFIPETLPACLASSMAEGGGDAKKSANEKAEFRGHGRAHMMRDLYGRQSEQRK
jgi:hypothetical protein